MRIAVCEDEEAVREHLIKLIQRQLPEADIMAFGDGREMIRTEETFVIYILDVEMGDISGMDVAKHIRKAEEERKSARSVIIFVTGYREYMEEAFDVNAFHYLVKPMDEERFEAVLGRAVKEAETVQGQMKKYILVKVSGIQRRVYLKDIYYIESANKKVRIHTVTDSFESYGTMEEYEQILGSDFYRCHRCYLVNMEKITAYHADTIQVTNGDRLILAQKKYTDFVKRYLRYAKEGGIVNV